MSSMISSISSRTGVPAIKWPLQLRQLKFVTRSGETCYAKKSKPAPVRRTEGYFGSFQAEGQNEKYGGKIKLVRWKGFDPSRYCYRQPLKLVRLPVPPPPQIDLTLPRSEEHTSELQSHSFISYAVFCLKKN